MGPRRFFQSVRSHTSPHTPKLATNIINIDGISYEGTDIIEGWAKYFKSLGSPDHHDSTMSPDCHSDISLLLEATPHSEPDLITEEEIACIIASLPSGKATGHDHLCNEHLKLHHL